VLAFTVREGVGLPEDFRYSYWTVLVGLVSSAITLGVVVLIAGRGNLRELLALRRPTSWWRAALIGVLVVVGTGLLLALLPFLQTSERRDSRSCGIPIAPSRSCSTRSSSSSSRRSSRS